MALMPADPPALVLLDLGLPGEDGFTIARRLREGGNRTGILMLTALGINVVLFIVSFATFLVLLNSAKRAGSLIAGGE